MFKEIDKAARLRSPSTGSARRSLQQLKNAKAGVVATSPLAKSAKADNDSSGHESGDDRSPSIATPAAASTVAKGGVKYAIDWTKEEADEVAKYYGLDTLFPNKWTEIDFGGENENEEEDLMAALKSGLGGDIDKSDPLKIKDNILKRKKGPMKIKDIRTILIGDKGFVPKTFLLEVHQETDFKSLEAGGARLKKTLEARKESDKGEVKKHFAKFVSAKSLVDSFYKEMKTKSLLSRNDFGIDPFERAINNMDAGAKKLYGPVLERREKANKIRIALTLLDQWKFFFNLTSNLNKLIQKGQFDAAVRDYKKGKYLMATSFKNKDGKPQGFEASQIDESALLPKNYQKTFEKLWEAVEGVIKGFRADLFKSLTLSTTTVDMQEKIIGYLIELDSESDPFWFYLEAQYKWVLEELLSAYNGKVMSIGVSKPTLEKGKSMGKSIIMSKFTEASLMASMSSLAPTDATVAKAENKKAKMHPLTQQESIASPPWTLEETKKALMSAKADSFEHEFSNDSNVQAWSQVLNFISVLKETLMSAISRFWRICCLYLESKGLWIPPRQLEAALEARRSHCNTMIRNIIMILETMIGEILHIKFKPSEVPAKKLNKALIRTPSTGVGELYMDSAAGKPKLEIIEEGYRSIVDRMKEFKLKNSEFYLQAHPLVIVHFAGQIVYTLNACINDMQSFYTLGEATILNSFNATVEKVSCYLLERVSSEWMNSKDFHTFEDWSFEDSASSTKKSGDTTALLKFYRKLSLFILKGSAAILTRGGEGGLAAAKGEGVEIIKSAVNSTLFSILDGIEWNFSNWQRNFNAEMTEMGHQGLKSLFPDHKRKFGQFIPSYCIDFVDITKARNINDVNTRNCILLCNLIFLRDHIAKGMQQVIENKLRTDISNEIRYFEDNCNLMENLVVPNFVKRSGRTIKEYLKEAIFYSGLDWSSLARPSDIRAYCYFVLQEFVYIHASVSEVSKSLTHKLMCALVEYVAKELLVSFRSIDQFNSAGMLQATLETEFLETCLKNYHSDASRAIFQQVYETLETLSRGSPQPAAMGEFLQIVKANLRDARAATITQYRCLDNTGV